MSRAIELFSLLVALSQIAACAGVTPAQSAPSVGYAQVQILNGEEPPLVAGIWYPASAHAQDHRLELVTQSVALEVPPVGHDLPLVVISHGGGGSLASHYDTALALARAGFVVAAVTHAGDTYDDQSRVLELWRRPAHLSRVITFLLDEWGEHERLDPDRIGAFGFSNGGFTVLAAAGGVPDLRSIDPYCREHPDHDLCEALREAGVASVAGLPIPAGAWERDPRIKAIVSAAPAFGFAFDRAGLEGVTVPVLLWRAANDDHQPHPWYEEAVLASLPGRAEYHVVADAGHYDFLPPCGEVLAAAAPIICVSAAGFDREVFHQRFNAEIVRFFQTSLCQRRNASSNRCA